MRKIGWYLLGWWCLVATSFAATPLPADQAFHVQAAANTKTLTLKWKIAPGYYLYQQRIHLYQLLAEPKQKMQAITLKLPDAIASQNPKLNNEMVYQDHLSVQIAQSAFVQAAEPIKIRIDYQGCAISGYCYPPQHYYFEVDWLKQTVQPIENTKNVTSYIKATATEKTFSLFTQSDQIHPIQEFISQHGFWSVVAVFFVLGVLISLTPCVLPMVPIVVNIVVKHQNNVMRSFSLVFLYVSSVAFTYALAGIAAVGFGTSLQGWLQQSWLLWIVALIFLVMGISLFDRFEIKLPSSWLTQLSAKTTSISTTRSLLQTILLGIISSLMLSPCVSAPLVAALAYVSQTQHYLLGGSALLALGYGMGLPLLIVAAVGTQYLPKSGPWMIKIKRLLGCILILLAIWLVYRTLPANTFEKMFTSIISTEKTEQTQFLIIKKLDDVKTQLKLAQQQHKPVLMDFYAQWCVSCQVLEQTVLTDPEVVNALQSFIKIRIDVTNFDDDDQAIMKAYGVFAPPTLIFFDADGKFLPQASLAGEISKEQLLKQL